MKKNYKELLNHVKAFVFDIDGVLTTGHFRVGPDGAPIRDLNSKDGYALQLAAKKGYVVAVISGGSCPGVKAVLQRLGLTDIYMAASHKTEAWADFLAVYEHTGLQEQNILYMGDDIPDIPVMQKAGVACAPKNAVPETRAVADYVSYAEGGHGCVRDVIQQTLKLQHNWMLDEDFAW
jgi:3-deoxy-D-manno-octulosonate 8-phosphate phosphatase (KDO 8-P phosphatase)